MDYQAPRRRRGPLREALAHGCRPVGKASLARARLGTIDIGERTRPVITLARNGEPEGENTDSCTAGEGFGRGLTPVPIARSTYALAHTSAYAIRIHRMRNAYTKRQQ